MLQPALGFGTSRMGHHPSKAKALASLQVAYDNGICYFDSAPIYSYGWSEKILGTFLQGKRDKLVVATKIGLQPSPILAALPFGLLRRVRQMAKAIKTQRTDGLPPGVSHRSANAFDTKSALSSLHASLRRLKTDYIDVLLLHEATVDEANDPEAIEFMEQVLSSGLVRAVGIGSAMDKLHHLNQLNPIYTIVQHEYDLFKLPEEESGTRMVNTHGLLQQVKRIHFVSNNTKLRDELQLAFNLEISTGADRLNFCLAGARYQYPSGTTLFSSTNHKHIVDTISAWNHPALSATQFQQAIDIIRKHIERI